MWFRSRLWGGEWDLDRERDLDPYLRFLVLDLEELLWDLERERESEWDLDLEADRERDLESDLCVLDIVACSLSHMCL